MYPASPRHPIVPTANPVNQIRAFSPNLRAVDLTPARTSSFLSWCDEERVRLTKRDSVKASPHLKGVDGIVKESPLNARDVQWQNNAPFTCPGKGRIAQESPPVECESKKGLGPVGDPFHERIGNHEGKRRGSKGDSFMPCQGSSYVISTMTTRHSRISHEKEFRRVRTPRPRDS